MNFGEAAAYAEDGGGVALIQPKNGRSSSICIIPDKFFGTSGHLLQPMKVQIYDRNKRLIFMHESIETSVYSNLELAEGTYEVHITIEDFHHKEILRFK